MRAPPEMVTSKAGADHRGHRAADGRLVMMMDVERPAETTGYDDNEHRHGGWLRSAGPIVPCCSPMIHR